MVRKTPSMSMITRLALGTVQFGQDYGIANTKGKIREEEVFTILDYAAESGIDRLDTAMAYGDSEERIGKYLSNGACRFNIVSKLPPLERYVSGTEALLLKSTLDRLGIKQLYGYLVHRFDDFLKYDGLWEGLNALRARGLVKRLGFSLYSCEELELLLDRKIDFDIIQIPYSIFDRRFEQYFDVLKKKGAEIQARSVFLQGLVFLSSKNLPVFFERARPQLQYLEGIADEDNISISALCLNFALANLSVDKVIIGVDSLEHLRANIGVLNEFDRVKNIYPKLQRLKIEDEEILLPFKWPVREVALCKQK